MLESNKSPEVEALLEKIAGSLYGRSRQDAFKCVECISCSKDCSGLEGIDIKEYHLSVLCPDCFAKGCPEE